MMDEEVEHVKCLIIGSGPAGYTAAIYAARADLKPVLYMGFLIGGQLTNTAEVDNYPGYPDGIMGPLMMDNFHKQAERMGADLRAGFVSKVDFSRRPYRVIVNEEKTLLADSVIISTGAAPKWLGLESEKKYAGCGVSACATCDGFFFKGEDVAIVGAGDTAVEEAIHLAGLSKKVYMLVRKSEFKASKAMLHRLQTLPNVEVMFNVEVKEIVGNGTSVAGVRIFNSVTMVESKLPITGFFVAIGHHPNTDIFKEWIDMDELGYIRTVGRSTKTNRPGVFCCGDAQDPVYRQAVTAAGSGCMAALDCERHLSGIEHPLTTNWMEHDSKRKTWHERHLAGYGFGERFADQVAAVMGSWRFIVVQTIIVAIWVAFNLIAYLYHWDPYPFILLNLLFSTQAAYAAPVIMMAQNRQNERDRIQAHDDYTTNLEAKREVEELAIRLNMIEKNKLDKIMQMLEEFVDPEKQ